MALFKRLHTIVDYIMDPVAGSPSRNRTVNGNVCMHVDDLIFTGTDDFLLSFAEGLKKSFQIGSLDENDAMFCGQRIIRQGATATVHQDLCIEDLHEALIRNGNSVEVSESSLDILVGDTISSDASAMDVESQDATEETFAAQPTADAQLAADSQPAADLQDVTGLSGVAAPTELKPLLVFLVLGMPSLMSTIKHQTRSEEKSMIFQSRSSRGSLG